VTNYYCNLAGFKPRIMIESDNPDTLKKMIFLGLGVTFIPELTAQRAEFGSTNLVTIQKPRCVRYINLALDNRDYYANAVLLFKQYVADYFQKIKQYDLLLAE
jgi:DNA-binding transcriptional LysR family regulator